MTDVTTIGDTLFDSGIDGAGNALGAYIELHFAQAIAAGNQVLAAALSEIERSAIISDMQSLAEHKVASNIAAEYEARALAAAPGSRQAEVTSESPRER